MASNTRLDGTPRLSADNPGSAGGVKDGFAVRRADGWSNSDTPAIGWLPAAAAKADVQGGPEVRIGPGTAAWSAGRKGPYTTGSQRKPKG